MNREACEKLVLDGSKRGTQDRIVGSSDQRKGTPPADRDRYTDTAGSGQSKESQQSLMDKLLEENLR